MLYGLSPESNLLGEDLFWEFREASKFFFVFVSFRRAERVEGTIRSEKESLSWKSPREKVFSEGDRL